MIQDQSLPVPDCFSTDGQLYNYDSVADAINSMDLRPGDHIFGGVKSPVSIESLVDADSFIDDIICKASDAGGEAADDYLMFVSKEAKAELEELIVGWLKKNGEEPTFYGVDHDRKITLTEEDFPVAATSEKQP